MTKNYATTLRDPEAARQRFASKFVVDASGCHLWQPPLGSGGYGRIQIEGRLTSAHRVAYILEHGSIPDGLELDHLCRVRHCVNPEHLEPVTKRENQLRSPISITTKMLSVTECPRGHSNYAVRCDGSRVCRDCINARQRRRSAAKREAR